MENCFIGLIARLMCCRGNKVEEDDGMIDEIALGETSWDETSSEVELSSQESRNGNIKEDDENTKASFHLKAK